jgi:hypothetical protein
MAKQTINVGTTANDRTGDPLRIAFTKINQNFTELYNVDANTVIISDISDLTDNSNLLFSGNYEDLANTPFIPTDLSDLTDNSNLLFSGNYEDLTNTPSIPTDLSELSDTQGLLNPPLTTFTNVVLTNSPLIIVPGENFFEKEDYATGNSAIDTFILDGEYGPIGITRGNDGGIYNPYREESWDEDVSPDGILWNLESSNDLSNIQTRTFLPFYQAYGGNLENVVPGSKAIMHIPDYGKYYVIEWLSWTPNNNGGGFSYNRYEIDENQIQEGVRFADGTVQTTAYTGSNANTGDITFDGVKIIGAGTESGDGNGYSTLELVPDDSLYENDQYLIIDPTEPSHIHLRAGGSQDNSNADLFLGGELNHVKVSDTNDTVIISTDAGGEGATHEWAFGPSGYLQFPGGSNGRIGEDEPGLVVYSDLSFGILTNLANTENSRSWVFTNEGDLTLPAGGTLTFPDDTVQSTAWTGILPNPTYSGSDQIGEATPAPLNLNNSAESTLLTQLNLINTGGGPGAGSAIDFWTYTTINDVPQVRLQAVDDGDYSADFAIKIKANGEGGNGNLTTTWTFGADGKFTVPGDIVGYQTYVNETPADERVTIQPSGSVDKSFLFTTDQTDGTWERSSMELPSAEINKAVTLGFPHNNITAGFIYNQGTDTQSGTEFNNAFNIMANSTDLKISTVSGGGNKVWKFAQDGDLTFPDATTQTTAFTANPTVNVLKIDDGVHEKFQELADATGTVPHDCSSGQIFYHSSPDANWTVNLTNLNLSSGYATTATIIIDQGNTGYYPNALQIGGSVQTINWQGNATPTPSSNRIDVVSFSILAVSGGYIVFGQLTGF